jgi:hypothetical protein
VQADALLVDCESVREGPHSRRFSFIPHAVHNFQVPCCKRQPMHCRYLGRFL